MRERHLVVGMAAVLLAALSIIALSDFWGENLITGMLTDPFGSEMEGTSMLYSVVHLKKVQMAYGLEEYEEMTYYARMLVDTCRGLPEQELTLCIYDNLQPNWNLAGNDGPYYMFDVASSYYTWEYDPVYQKIMERGILYRFALDFS